MDSNGTYHRELIPFDSQLVVMLVVHLWCMLRGSVQNRLESNLFWFIESQTQFKHLMACQTEIDPQ